MSFDHLFIRVFIFIFFLFFYLLWFCELKAIVEIPHKQIYWLRRAILHEHAGAHTQLILLLSLTSRL